MYRLKLSPAPFENRGGDLELRLPKLDSPAANGAVAVQQLRLAVWAPEEYAFVGTPKNFTLETRPALAGFFLGRRDAPRNDDLERWIDSEARGVFDFPTEGRRHVYSSLGPHDKIELHWWHLPFYTWVISGAFVLIAFVLRNTGCENKLTIALLAAFAAAAYALSHQDVIVHGLGAASYGLVIAAALWIIHALTTRPPAPAIQTAPPQPPMPVQAPPESHSPTA
jgi:hypothetical protein